MTIPPLDADTIRTIIREEGVSLRKWMNARLDEMEERTNARLNSVEARLDGVEGGLEAVRQDLAKLREELVGVIDKRFPPIDQQRTGSTPRGFRAAAKAP